VALSEPSAAGMSLAHMQIAPEAQRAVYALMVPGQGAEPRMDSVHVTELDAPGGRVVADGGGISGLLVAPGGRHVMIQADRNGDGVDELYVAVLDS
jgi:hypothetical protein